MERKEIFSIKKLKVGAASVLIGTGIVFLGSEASVALANESVVETTVNRANSDDVGDNSVNLKNSLNNDKMGVNSSTTPQQADTNSIKPTENNSNSSNVYTTNEVSDLENKTNTVDKKDMDIVTNKNSEKISKRSKRSLTDSETIDYSGVKISGKLTNSKTDYAVGEQILGSYNLDVSSPSKIEDGGYILVTASSNEPLDTFEIGTSLRTEKVSDNQYKLYTGELSGGAYVNINVSYKLKKFETGKNSTTTIKAELFDKNNTLIKSTDFSNTNTTGTPYVSVDTRNGIRKQTLLETNQQETEIDVSKSKDLQLSLKSTNKEAAAITKIDHAVELPAGVTIAQTSLDAGWRLENGVAKYTRVVPSSTTMFASGDNTQNELLHLNVSNGGTPAEFLTGKKLTFKDSATYTDKSGFTNTTSDDVTVTVHALNPKKSIDGSDPGTVVGPVPTKSNVQVDIANITMEGDKSRVVNIAMPYVKTTTEDTRNIKLLGAYKGANGPASVKEVEISIDSNIDQNRAIEFYAIWTPTDEGKSTFVSYQNNPESLGLKSTLTFEVYSVANGTEKKIGEVSLRKGDAADKVALPDGITTVRLRPKGNMPLEASGLRQVGLFLSQDLKGLEEAKKIAKEGKKVESIVTSSVYTYGYDEPKVDVSKTTFANSREAIKLAPTTNPITATLAGNKTQELSSQYEVYEYSPNGLGNRIYNKQIFDRKTYVNLQDINAKNAKLLVELPDGFSYAGDDDSVKTVENYNNSGKTVLEVTPKNQNSEYTLSPNLQFKVDKWVESGKYPVKYTLVWDEDERVVGINPNNDYDGTNTTITNTSSFTYELPVINNSATRLMTQVTDQTTDSSTYSTGAYNLAPNDKVKYRLSLTNSSNAATRNNVVISTLPRVSDKNIVLNSKDRGSQFDVHMTAAATTPEGWTAYYSTTPVSGTAVDLEKTITLTADQVTDWSTVTAVKFVSNQDIALKAGSTAAFYIPAKASSTATNNQVAVLTSATRTDGQDTFNETNPARISIKIEDVKKGAVKVAYENKDNNSIKDTVTAIESRAYKKGYDVDTKEYKPDTLIGKDGKEYYFVKVKDSSPRPTGTIDSPEVTVTYVYDLLYDETEESHTVTRTIKYIDAEKKTQVADPVTQTATIKRVNKVNRKTKEVIEGAWSTANWDEKISPRPANYGTPDQTSVSSVAVTPTTENTEVVVKYPQAVDTKTVATKQTVTYEGAGDKTPVPNEQTDYTFTGKTNKVTNVTTWNEETHTYGVVTTPKVEGYYANKAQAGGKEVTPTNPEASDKVEYKPLGKVILVDEGGNEIPNTPKLTYKNNPNDPTVGGETPIPEIPDGYEIKPKQDVPGFNPEGKVVTPQKPGEDIRIVLVAKQGDVTKATKQTVTYEGAGDKTPAPNEQTNYTFTGKTNKVTNVTTWNEETHTYGVVTTPKVEGYYADKAQAGGQVVTPTSPEASDKVVYKPLGKVILVDEGGNEIPNTPKPTYKNAPNDDPTLGGETPIPEIPEGYEIKPKQDVPGFNPEGKVVTPQKPGEDTRIVLVAKVEVNQKATVKYVVEGTNTVLHTDKLEGKSGAPIDYTTATKLAELKADGYELVTDGFTTATDKNYDNNPKVDQEFLVTVAKTVPVTPTTPQNPNEDPQNPQPGDPINPENPNGPKWTKEALDKLNNIKSVTRTITYIKDGTTEEVSPTEAPKWTDKVSFTRTVVVNPKDGSVVGYDTTGDGIADVAATDTTSGWTAADTAKFAEVKSPVVKGYVVKPNQDTQGDLVEADGSKVKASTTDLTVDSANQDLKVRYVPVGKLVPKVPEGVTPPTPVTPTPYENVPGEPGKVVPPSPTKPTDPQDPNSPKVPVIPHIPGTTPKDPEGSPLKPVDPTDPTKGYVPPTPKTPTENTEINYEKDAQKATVKYVVDGTNTVLHEDELKGESGKPIQYKTESKLAELKKLGYELVTDGFVTATDKNFDNDPKVDQSFLVTVAKTVPVTPTTPQNPNEDPKNPNPGDPIDPKNPNGPKWTKEALDKLNNIKSVTRTITYVKDGTDEEVSLTEAPKVTNKVSFTRTVVVNPKDGSVVGYDTTGDGVADVPATNTTSGWTAAGTTKFAERTSPVVKGYVVKPNQDTQGDLVEADGSKVKASTTDLTVDSPNQDLKVRYVPVGTWTPKVPEGETPINPIPYPNDPTDPGKVVDPNKPTDPNEPNKPSVPVIPHIPGTTPKDPEGNPLKPVDPQDPSKGYVPPTPKTPTENTEIKYEKDTQKDTQKATVKYVVEGTNTVLHTDKLEGKSGEPINYSTATKLAELKALGYELVNDGFTTAPDNNFDKDTNVDQNFDVIVKPKVVDVPPFDSTNPNDPNTPKPGQPIDPENPTGPKWTEELIKSLETTKHVNRTISYVKEDGSKVEYTDKDGNKSTADVTDKVTFTRPAKVNVVTGTIEYDKWTPVNNDTTFDKVTSPVAPGYVLKDAAQKEVAETTGLTENSKDETIKVVYVPVGKLVPKIPEGITPPTPVTLTPYENVPGEPGKVVPPSPTKPTDPQDPNSPKVPVIPYIPGTTPQVPKDPTKLVDPNTNPLVPLEPVTPGKPEDGYKVPPVPTDPTKNLEINYEKDTQEAVTKFVDPSGKPIPGVTNIEETGKSGEPLTKATEVTTEIAKLIAKGYDLVSNNYGKDNNGNFDKDKSVKQEYTVVLTTHIQDVPPFDSTNPNDPNTPKPGQPIDPENPTGPKWTEELIKSLETTKHVNRTISYVKEDGSKVEYTDKDGNKSTAEVTDKVTFTRPAKINVVTGTIEYGKWTPANNDTTFDKVTSPVAPGYVLKDPAQKEVAETTGLTENSKDETIKVVYVPVGKVTVTVPPGVIPPTPVTPTPYENVPGEPGKVVPPSPTKPTDPQDPNSPKVPVLPHIPGTTPQVPKDPTKPVDPNTNPLVPLKPIDPQDPSKGYEVPPVPTDPTKNLEINYEKDTQKAVTKFVDLSGNPIPGVNNIEETGKSGEPLTKATEVTTEITKLIAKGYDLVSNNYGKDNNGNFDKDSGKDQEYTVVLTTHIQDVPPFDSTNPNDPNTPKPGQPIDPENPTGPKWTEELIKSLETTKHVNRTISYVKEDGSKVEYTDKDGNKSTADVTDKVTFTRPAKINLVIGKIEHGNWTAVNGDNKFDAVLSPVVKGYVLKDSAQKEVAATENLTENSKDENIKVVYVPVGTWTPKVPEGETPIDPIPYPNDPTDPGKVVDPNKPTDPNEPNKPSVPVIPHIPGTTPKDSEGNPLKPVDPQDPSKGYVPPTPKIPTENTEIKYEKDTQKATVKYVVEGTNTVLHTDELEGKSGEAINYSTADKLADLRKLGYELVTDGFTTAPDKNFDKDTKVDQNFVVTVKPKVVDVPPFDPTNPNDQNTPKPGKPIDPENPTGPKWTEELIKSLETTKHVNRTISYVKEDGNKVEYTDKAGNKSTADVTDKVTFTRPAKVNVVTGTIEYGKWTPVNNDTTFDKVTSPVAPGYVLKDASQKEIAETTGLTENSKDENIKVVYVPVGKLVPKVPEGVTPPTPTPYENVPGEPGKVVPPSPTKPQDPNSPKVPVLPHIPGTTPQVPQDPTKPVDPNTNPLVPLKPVDPKDPSKGYEVPPVPTNPNTDTPIYYVNDKQKAITNFVDNNGKVVSDPVVDQGDSGSKFTKSDEVESKIKELVKKGYVVTSNEYPSDDKDRVFDKDKDKDQIFNVKVTALIVPTDPNSPDKPQVPTDPTKPVGPNNPLKPVTPSTPEPGKPVFPEDPNSPVWPETVKDMVTESSATRTITYVDQNGKEVAATHTETIKFKRSAKVNLVTGEITYGEWTVVGDDTILDGNKLPKVDGYIARGGDIKESQEDIKATVGTNITQTVVYDKLGSWVPKVPENATPVPPITYPNNPTDPTKPGTDKPRVPHVPGFIPVGPDGTPLKPVDPKDSSKGYEVPDVPTDPTKDTPISYVPVTPEKPTPERINPKPTPVVPVQPEGPVTPATPKAPAKAGRLANTGTTETNTGLAGLGLGILGVLLAAARRRKEKNKN